MSVHRVSSVALGYNEVESDWLSPVYLQILISLPAGFADLTAKVPVTVLMAHLPYLFKYNLL